MKKFRLNLLINKEFQLKLIIGALIPFIASLGVLYWQATRSLSEVTTLSKAMGLEVSSRVYDILIAQKSILDNYFLWGGLICLGLSTFVLLFISNKLAGPIYRLEKHVKEINQSGKYTAINFRDGDYLKGIEGDLNQIIIRDNKEDRKKSA